MKIKMKTHSGAKKRFSPKPSGRIKRKKKNKNHILQKKSSKRKRQLGKMAYVHPVNQDAIERQLCL